MVAPHFLKTYFSFICLQDDKIEEPVLVIVVLEVEVVIITVRFT